MLAAKTALAARVDALGEDSGTAMGIENRAKLELRLKALEENQVCTVRNIIAINFLPMLQATFWHCTCEMLSSLDISYCVTFLLQCACFSFRF